MISLSDLEDDRMRSCKSGSWWEHNSQRALANNSAAYTSKPDIGQFLAEWTSLYNSHSGERGIFSREASKTQAEKNGRRDASYDFGTNPCSEIILRPYQFCNLTEVVVRAEDTVADINNDGTFKPVACLTTNSLTSTNDTIDATSKCGNEYTPAPSFSQSFECEGFAIDENFNNGVTNETVK